MKYSDMINSFFFLFTSINPFSRSSTLPFSPAHLAVSSLLCSPLFPFSIPLFFSSSCPHHSSPLPSSSIRFSLLNPFPPFSTFFFIIFPSVLVSLPSSPLTFYSFLSSPAPLLSSSIFPSFQPLNPPIPYSPSLSSKAPGVSGKCLVLQLFQFFE